MKILIFSDTHLTGKFDEKKYNFLVKIISSADKVVIAGDFWDNWFTDFNSFVNCKWNALFPLMLNKEAVYVYGNHDPIENMDGRVDLFSVKHCDTYTLKMDGNSFLVMHGDKLLKNNRPGWLKVYGYILEKTNKTLLGEFLHRVLHFLELLSFSIFGTQRMTHTLVSMHNNLRLKSRNVVQNEWLVCGDTHCAEIDRALLFANSGCIEYGYGTYLIIEDGEINLYVESY